MPPKRKSSDSGSSAKKSKGPAKSPEVDMETERALNKRWAPVSTEVTENESEDEEDEEFIEQKKKDDAEADDATTLEPASEHPGEKWIFTNAGVAKWIALKQCTAVRDPDNFEMHVYNDFFGYAVMELVENLLLDFDEAAGDWKMQWAICEATGLYFQMSAIMSMVGCEDGDTVNAICTTFATMFPTMLATLERNDLFKSDSEVKNLGAVIGLFIRFIVDVEEYGINWDDHDAKIAAYATKHDITVHGLNHKRYEKSSREEFDLPEATADSNDPWGWQKALATLKEIHDENLGGDSKDITSWTSAERKKASFNNKDPIPRSAMTHIKNGDIMELGG
ncbi:hypothetical protein PENVUL_c002G00083 [Penicillium vulpinum]|uniref:Uncharacterized protein n=1 Tax=Penicillium vulpinum TaxID=29845 RepID=A0A1V6SCN1_9EURO|nr:hypothetical protein PENVUL_c002G00083 [Penicillium vulpinum]